MIHTEEGTSSPERFRGFAETGQGALMQALTGHNPGDFHWAALNTRIGEQHFAQWAAAQPGQSAATTVQGGGRNQRPGEHPGLIATKQLHFASPGPGVQPQTQSVRFVAARSAPALPEHTYLELVWAALAQPAGQGTGVKQPPGQFDR